MAAGIFATLAAMTNLTAAPFLLILIVYMWCVAPKRAAWMAGPSIVLAGIITAAMEIYTGGYFLNNVVFNQVGTYPPNLLEYAILKKLLPESNSVFLLEGAFVIFGLVGLARFVKESPLMPVARGGLAWFFVGTLGSILYVTKGGTMDYIFSLSEPAVAILAAGELAAWLRRWWCAPPLSRTLLQRVVGVPILLAVVLFAFPRGALLHYQLFVHSKTIYELPRRRRSKSFRSSRATASPATASSRRRTTRFSPNGRFGATTANCSSGPSSIITTGGPPATRSPRRPPT